jgi:hypothetical protein
MVNIIDYGETNYRHINHSLINGNTFKYKITYVFDENKVLVHTYTSMKELYKHFKTYPQIMQKCIREQTLLNGFYFSHNLNLE